MHPHQKKQTNYKYDYPYKIVGIPVAGVVKLFASVGVT